MCGIYGIVDPSSRQIDRESVVRATNTMRHRGPDGEGFAFFDNVALGHRRLSIIDPDGGQQPISNEDGSVTATYNGEIYNFPELRKSWNHTATFSRRTAMSRYSFMATSIGVGVC